MCVFTFLFHSPFFPVDQSMFENSIAQRQSPQTSTRRPPASAHANLGSTSVDSPSSGGQQRLKNAINLGKAVGAKVNDLLRRKEPNHLGDIGVTEVNKNVGAESTPLICIFTFVLSSSHLDSFPRLDPPPPTGKKRLPRALKTTQDMMISSDPVVSSPDPEELKSTEEQQQGEEAAVETTLELEEEKAPPQLQLSVPDLINKDPPQQEPRAKPCDVWLRVSDSRLASTPCSGKTPYRISLGEEVLGENGTPCSRGSGVGPEDTEPHPDLLSFE
uniref:Uncharacterized protein n=1 Tax=Mola mola TaxID=94237 RepID=A0A3Q3WYB7_MOLML